MGSLVLGVLGLGLAWVCSGRLGFFTAWAREAFATLGALGQCMGASCPMKSNEQAAELAGSRAGSSR